MIEKQITKNLKVIGEDDVAVQITSKVLRKVKNKKERNIVGTIEIVDFDLDRVYLSLNGDDNERLTIRTWDMHKEGDRVRVWYTLFDENERREDGSKFKIEEDGNILIY